MSDTKYKKSTSKLNSYDLVIIGDNLRYGIDYDTDVWRSMMDDNGVIVHGNYQIVHIGTNITKAKTYCPFIDMDEESDKDWYNDKFVISYHGGKILLKKPKKSDCPQFNGNNVLISSVIISKTNPDIIFVSRVEVKKYSQYMSWGAKRYSYTTEIDTIYQIYNKGELVSEKNISDDTTLYEDGETLNEWVASQNKFKSFYGNLTLEDLIFMDGLTKFPFMKDADFETNPNVVCRLNNSLMFLIRKGRKMSLMSFNGDMLYDLKYKPMYESSPYDSTPSYKFNDNLFMASDCLLVEITEDDGAEYYRLYDVKNDRILDGKFDHYPKYFAGELMDVDNNIWVVDAKRWRIFEPSPLYKKLVERNNSVIRITYTPWNKDSISSDVLYTQMISYLWDGDSDYIAFGNRIINEDYPLVSLKLRNTGYYSTMKYTLNRTTCCIDEYNGTEDTTKRHWKGIWSYDLVLDCKTEDGDVDVLDLRSMKFKNEVVLENDAEIFPMFDTTSSVSNGSANIEGFEHLIHKDIIL